MTSNDSIKDTLDVIRRALEDENDFSLQNDNVLILNKKINEIEKSCLNNKNLQTKKTEHERLIIFWPTKRQKS